MVRGLDRFRAHFADHSDRYVLIGGTAATLTMEESGLQFRATKDLDILLVVEALDSDFGQRMWEFVELGNYQVRQTRGGQSRLYRFEKPRDASYPYMLELFSRRLDNLVLSEEAQLTPLPLHGSVPSLSAILLDDDYYEFVMQGRREANGLAWIEADRLIPLKASAWLDLTARKKAGEQVDGRDLRKHLNDVIRLSQLLSVETRIPLPAKVKRELDEFLVHAEAEQIDIKQLLGSRTPQAEIIARMRAVYGLDGASRSVF
jgi:hypothetical protein